MATKKTAKAKKGTTSTKPAPAAPKKGKGSRGPRSGSKTAFIIGQGMDAPAKDIVDAGAKAGFSFDVKYVYAVRSGHRSKEASSSSATRSNAASTKTSKKGPAARTPARGNNKAASTGSLEAQFNRLAVEMGIANAEAALRRVREKLDRMSF